ncbi:hypothetical protein PQO03_11480 [Lentisphaera profundi]|uniref:Uncharacterized protein n=1 Tax=Lentisphaera profundi TaxID=1658616 RepID=A0ABY7VQ74_9BACT|nr:hypothetical protein [Lentisphaera profundi]WDE96330.1 hypothetical protein PQO03_11480 [Lentisphaera profundi]
MNKAIAPILYGFELAFLGYLTLMAYLICIWMIDDSLAFELTTLGWIIIGLKRLIICLTASVIISFLLYQFNKVILNEIKTETHKKICIVYASIISISAIIGSIIFIIKKPYM